MAKKIQKTFSKPNSAPTVNAPQALKLVTSLNKLLSQKKENLKNATRVDPSLFRGPQNKKSTVLDRIRLIGKINNILSLKGKKRSREVKKPKQAKVSAGGGNPEPPSDSDSDSDDEKWERKEKKQKTLDNILKDAKKGKNTGGPSQIYEKSGDFDTANEDFDSLKLDNISDKGNGIRVGTLPDGRTVTVRPKSSGKRDPLTGRTSNNGPSTLEIKSKTTKMGRVFLEIIKIRYL